MKKKVIVAVIVTVMATVGENEKSHYDYCVSGGDCRNCNNGGVYAGRTV